MFTQNEYNVAKQVNRELDIIVNVLKKDSASGEFFTVSEIKGNVLSCSFSENASSDIRRTGSVELAIESNDTSFGIEEGSKIWLDKYLQVYVGIRDIHTDEFIYTNKGIYLINNPQTMYDATTNSISVELVDLMATLTGLRNGNLVGMSYQIPQNSNIRESIIGVLEEVGIVNYIVENVSITTPNIINIDSGGTVYDILKQLCDIVSDMQMYFDVNGVFHYERIPNGVNEQIFVDDDLMSDLIIGYNTQTSYDEVKNTIEVYGKTHDIQNYSSATLGTSPSNVYSIALPKITTLTDGILIGFTPSRTFDGSGEPQLKVNDLVVKPIRNQDYTAIVNPNTIILSATYYVVKYNASNGGWFEWLGHVTPSYTIVETNPNSPFLPSKIGTIRKVFSGGEYDNIYSDYLAEQRAKFELYHNCRLKDSISITCVPIYFMETNKVVRLTLPNVDEQQLYITKEISEDCGVDGTQTINLMKYYPLYPSI